MARLPRSGATPPGGNAATPTIALLLVLALILFIGYVHEPMPPRDEVHEISPHAYVPPTADEIWEARGEPVEPPLPPEEEIEGL